MINVILIVIEIVMYCCLYITAHFMKKREHESVQCNNSQRNIKERARLQFVMYDFDSAGILLNSVFITTF